MSFRRMFAALAKDLEHNTIPDCAEPIPFNPESGERPLIPRQVNFPVYRAVGLWKSEVRAVPLTIENGTIRVEPEFIRNLCNAYNQLVSNPDFFNNVSTYIPFVAIIGFALEVTRNILSNAKHTSPGINITFLSVEAGLAFLSFVLTMYSKYVSSNNVEVGLEAHESKKSLGCRI